MGFRTNCAEFTPDNILLLNPHCEDKVRRNFPRMKKLVEDAATAIPSSWKPWTRWQVGLG